MPKVFFVKFAQILRTPFFTEKLRWLLCSFEGWGHPLSTYAKFSEKLTFLTPWNAHVRVRIRGLEMLVFRKNLRTYLMDSPYSDAARLYSLLPAALKNERTELSLFILVIHFLFQIPLLKKWEGQKFIILIYNASKRFSRHDWCMANWCKHCKHSLYRDTS